MSDSPVSPDDVRAAAAAYQELGPEYHDAVVASFLDKVDREVAARVDARLAGMAPVPARPRKPRRALALTRKRVLRDAAAAAAGALAFAGVIAVTGSHTSPMVHPVPQAQVRVLHGAVPREILIRPGGRGRVAVPVPAPPAPPAPKS